MPQPAESPTKPSVLWIIHAAFIIAVFAYLYVIKFVLLPGQSAPSSPDPIMFYTLVLVAFFNAGLGFILPSFLLRTMDQKGDPNPSPEFWLGRRLKAMIISDAFFEAIAIYGVVLTVLDFPFDLVWPFLLAAALLLVFNIARIRSWIDDFEHRQSSQRGLR
jgi:hypothetical protein